MADLTSTPGIESTLPLYQVDAFTDVPFAGNPAAVCILETAREDQWLQAVAAEMNLSETAFLLPGPDGYSLRWFTPAVEVDLCGHATLAAAHVLFSQGYSDLGSTLQFSTRSGILTARSSQGQIVLDFPAQLAKSCPIDPGIIGALGAEPLYTGRNREDYLVEVASEQELLALTPDFSTLASLTQRGVIVTCAGGQSGYDFLSRFFAPGIGVDEDPVTGSAHCCLGPYWQGKLGKNRLHARQISRRGGDVGVEVLGERVLLLGLAVTVFQGNLIG